MQSWLNEMTKPFAVSRTCAAHMCAVLLVAVLTGCFSISITHEFDEAVDNRLLGGRYSIKGVEPLLAAALRENAPQSIVFTEEDDPSAVPLSDIKVSSVLEEKDSTSAFHFVPGFLTLCAFPALMEEQKTRYVSFSTPFGARKIGVTMIGRVTVCWTPLGLLPFAFPLDAYDYTFDDLMNKWRNEKEQTWDNATVNAAAKAVIATLALAEYDAYIKDISDAAQRMKMSREANKREGILRMAENRWPQEDKLRDFAIKETVALWDVVVAFRAEITVRKTRLSKLNAALSGFGRNPDDDPDYVKCSREYDAAREALVQIFKRLEDAFLYAKKNEALYGSKEARTRTREAVEDCSRVAVDAAKRILNK